MGNISDMLLVAPEALSTGRQWGRQYEMLSKIQFHGNIQMQVYVLPPINAHIVVI